MEKALLLSALMFVAAISCATAAEFMVDVVPSTINASRETLLTFTVFNLNDTQNITQMNITLPDGFSYKSVSSSSGNCAWIAASIVKCEGDPFIESTSSTTVNISVVAEVASPPQYSFLFTAVDTSNIVTTNYTNVSVNDIDFPLLLSVFPGNFTVKYQESGVYIFNASFFDNVAINSTEFFWNDVLEQVNYTSSKTFSTQIVKTDLGAGTYNYTWRVNDSSGNANFSTYFFNITQADNPITFYLNGKKDQNITVENGTTVNITIVGKGNISAWLNEGMLATPREGWMQVLYTFESVGMYKIFANASGNQNYTSNSTGATFFIRVIYPSLGFKDLKAPSSVAYSPGGVYTFRITFYSPAYPLNNISNVSFAFNGQTHYLPVNNPQSETYTFTLKDLGAGTYNWGFCAEDTQGEINCTSGTLTITQATPHLDIINAQDYIAPVNKTIIGIGCPSQLTCKLYLNHTELSSNFYELNTDKPGYYIFTFNTSGNANYSAASITKALTVYPPRQTTTTLQPTTTTTTTTLIQQGALPSGNVLNLKANVPSVLKIENPDLLKVTEVEITAREDVESVEVKVEIAAPNEIPKVFVQSGKILLTYLKITSNASADKFSNVKIRFKVEKLWINANNIDAARIALYKFENEDWVKIPTEKMLEDDDNVYYEATLTSLSFFVIAGETKTGFPRFLLLIPIIIIVVAIIVYLFWPIPIGNEYEKLKQKWIRA